MYIIRFIKYIFAGLIIVLAIEYTSKCRMSIREQLMIGAIASITFSLLELYFPTNQLNNNKLIK